MRNYLIIIKTILKNKLFNRLKICFQVYKSFIKEKLFNQKQNIKTYDDVHITTYDPAKHLWDLYILYPDYVKDSNIENLPFIQFYSALLQYIIEGSSIVYTIIETKTGNVIGFIVGEEMSSFILNAHIVIHKNYRNFYNACKASKIAINHVFSGKYKQVIAEVNRSNKNVRVLLKKLGFELWGIGEKTEVYSIIKAHGRW